jgi:hypothetical protein
MLAGARPEAAAGALGNSLEVAFQRWHKWAIQQRDRIIETGARVPETHRGPSGLLRMLDAYGGEALSDGFILVLGDPWLAACFERAGQIRARSSRSTRC